MKTGKGFYTHPDPVYAQAGFAVDGPELDLPDRALSAALIQSAVLLADKGVAEPAEIDRAWMAATRLDRGPFGILEQIGVDVFCRWPESGSGLLSAPDARSVRTWLLARGA